MTPFGLYEFAIWITQCPGHFPEDDQPCTAYLDDVVIHSKTLIHLQEVFVRLLDAGLTLKVEKCQFGRKKVHHLGHVIGGGCVQPDPGKLKAMLQS